MKFATALIITLLLSLTAFSQKDTATSKLILSHKVGKQVAIDLVSCDSTRAVLQVTDSVLKLTKEKSRLQDTVIKTQFDKINIYSTEIKILNQQGDEYQKLVARLQKSLKIEKVKSKTFLYSGLGVFIAGSIYIISHK